MLGKEIEIKQLSWGWVANHILTSGFLRHLPHCVFHVHINRNFSLLADINRNKFLLRVPQLHYLYDSGDLPISAFYLQPRVITQKTSFSGCEWVPGQPGIPWEPVSNKQTNKTKQQNNHRIIWQNVLYIISLFITSMFCLCYPLQLVFKNTFESNLNIWN